MWQKCVAICRLHHLRCSVYYSLTAQLFRSDTSSERLTLSICSVARGHGQEVVSEQSRRAGQAGQQNSAEPPGKT